MTGRAPVSVIVPLFNGRRFVRQAIASIEAQTLPLSEILVIDDGSSDGGAALLDGIAGLTTTRQDHAGEAAARNRGIAAATQPLIAFLDQDDLWRPEKLRLQLAVLERDPGIDIVFGLHRLIVEDDAGWFRRDLLDRPLSARLPGALLVRRSVFDRIGLFREFLSLGSDVDWTWRASDAGLSFHRLEEEVLLRRVHRANASRDMAQFADGLLVAAPGIAAAQAGLNRPEVRRAMPGAASRNRRRSRGWDRGSACPACR